MAGKLFAVLGVVTALTALVGCRESDEATTEDWRPTVERGALQLAPNEQHRLGIVVDPVRRETIAVTKSAIGWLQAPPAAQNVVRAPISGFVVAVPDHAWPVLGQTVQPSETIARVNVFLTPQEVSQLVIAKKDNDAQMQQALVTMELSEARLNHVLTARDAVAGVRIDQIKEAFAHSKVAYKEAQDKQPYLIQEPSRDGLLVKPVDVEAAIGGRVLQVHVVNGQFVLSGDPLWTVTDWSTLWVRVPLFEGDARRISAASVAEVRDPVTGTAKAATPIAVPTESKPVTRTIDYYYAIDNSDWRLRVGQSTTVEIPIIEDREVILIPRSAVLYNSFGQASCFVATMENTTFIRTRIELGVRHQDLIEVTRGLDADDDVVVVGAEQLAAEELKDDLFVEDDD